ncbi:MAG: DEAD/DEAH box helicase [Bacteroidota bacterium]
MEEKFALTLTAHRRFGDIITPYWIEKQSNKVYYSAKERITEINLSKFEKQLEAHQKEAVKLCEEYNDQTLLKLFSKKKKSVKDFINEVEEEYFENHIRPYIERRIAKLTQLIIRHEIPFFHKVEMNNLHPSDKIIWAGENCSTVFNFSKKEEGTKYFLTIRHKDKTISLTNKHGQVICNDPCILILENTLFRFNDIDGKKLLPFFTKEAVFINKQAEEKYYSSFVLNTIKKYQVNAEGFTVEKQNPKPVAFLFIERDLSQLPVLTLKYRYGPKNLILANRNKGALVSFDKENFSFTCIDRDYGWEKDRHKKLEQLGLLRKNEIYYSPPDISEPETGLYILINWLNEHKSMVENHGFVLEQEKPGQKYYTGEFELTLNVEDYTDWFDVRAYVVLGEIKIPFIALRNHIIKGIREYRLPNNEVFILPEEWFSKYRELFTFSEDVEEGLKIKKQHFTVLQEALSGFDKKAFEQLAEINLESRVQQSPAGLNANLRPYQLEGYSWMVNMQKHKFGTCLADDMGLGKTLQTLALLQHDLLNKKTGNAKSLPGTKPTQLSLFGTSEDMVQTKEKQVGKPTLIILPTSLVHNWLNEINKFLPDCRVSAFVGTSRSDFSEFYHEHDIILTSYGIIRNDLDVISRYPFNFLILDESQTIKNHESKTYQAVMKLKASHKVVLTGTPIENSLSDLWSQMNFLNPGILGDFNFFKNEFITPIESRNDREQQLKLKQLIQPFILRRTKSQVAKDLPELTEQTVFCDMSEDQERFYEIEKSKVRNSILENIGKQGIEKSTMIILQSLTRLRQIANHPSLFDTDYGSDSGKFEDVTRKLENLKSEGHKVLVFSSFVKHLNLIANHLEENHSGYVMLTGATKNREDIIKKFQENEDINYFLISLKAGGVGLNLTAADYVFILDPWWNPAAEQQAISRAHRIGQHNKVMAYRFISNSSIEEKIIRLQDKKNKLADAFVNSNNPFKGITRESLMELFD